MEVYNLKVQNLKLQEAVQKIVTELKKIYAVKLVDVNLKNSQVKVILDDLGSIGACKTALQGMGYPVEQLKK